MTPRFAGKVAVVTGGAMGIGLATAHAFAAECADIRYSGAKTLEIGRAPEPGG